MAYPLLILTMAILLIRPAEAFPALASIPFYEIAILSCLVLTMDPLFKQLTGPAFKQRPITAFLVVYVLVAIATNLAHFQFDGAVEIASNLLKAFLFYLLVNALVDRPKRFSFFIMCVSGAIFVTTSLALLNYFQVVLVPGFRLTQDGFTIDATSGLQAPIVRLGGPMSLGDPNDFCSIVVLGMILALYGISNRRLGWIRLAWLIPLAIFIYAIKLTQSRGGLLAALVGILVLLEYRFGWRKTLLLAMIAIPALLTRLGGRQGSLSTTQGTGQSRIQLWHAGLHHFFDSPIIGLGNNWAEQNLGHSLHNSFLQAFVDMGLIGGLLFFGCFYYAIQTLQRSRQSLGEGLDPELRRAQPYVLAATAGFAMGIITLNHCYTFPTFLILSIVMSFIRILDPTGRQQDSVLSQRLITRLTSAGLVFLAGLYGFVQLKVRW